MVVAFRPQNVQCDLAPHQQPRPPSNVRSGVASPSTRLSEPEESAEELGVVGIGESVQVPNHGGGAGGHHLTVRSTDHAGQREPALPGRDPVDQGGERLVPLAGDRVVDPGKGARVLDSHLAFEVGAAIDRHHLGVAILDHAAEGERRHRLLERAGEADGLVGTPADLARPALHQRRNPLVAEAA